MDPTQGANVQGLARLVSSSKGLIFIGAVVAGLVLVFTGHLGAELVYGKIVTLAMVFFSAVAVEDGSRHLADRPRAAPVTVNMQTVPPPPAPAPAGPYPDLVDPVSGEIRTEIRAEKK